MSHLPKVTQQTRSRSKTRAQLGSPDCVQCSSTCVVISTEGSARPTPVSLLGPLPSPLSLSSGKKGAVGRKPRRKQSGRLSVRDKWVLRRHLIPLGRAQRAWAPGLGLPDPSPVLPLLPELEGVKFCAWLLARCGPWLGQNICLLLWLPYT